MKRVSIDELPTLGVSHNPEIGKKVMLDHRAAPGLTNFSQAIFTRGQIAPGHAHEDMYEVFFVRRGLGKIVVEGRQYDLEPGLCILIEPGEIHEISSSSQEALELLYFGLRDSGREVPS